MALGAGDIPTRWRELQGSESWAGLLDPLDSDLRASLIAYGELAEATYDGFNKDAKSPKAGQCMYSSAVLLAASGVSHPEYYTVTKLLYATVRPWSESESESSSSVTKAMFVPPATELPAGSTYTNWIGYVAVATDEGVAALGRRDIVVAWRGTVKLWELVADVKFWPTSAATLLGPYSDDFPDAKVHHGFLSVYTTSQKDEVCQTDSARDQALAEVRRLMEVHKDEVISITVTGHSLGGSLATLNAIDMVANGVNVPPSASSKQLPCPVTTGGGRTKVEVGRALVTRPPATPLPVGRPHRRTAGAPGPPPVLVTVIQFASPRTGNEEFKRAFAFFPKLRALGVINEDDIVPKLPPFWYVDATTATVFIDTTRSPYLRPGGLFSYHNLECYLHGVAGDHGPGKDFILVVDRDVVLVNKGSNALNEGYPVPAEWWNANYKGQGTMKDVVGRWKLDKLQG